VSFPASQRNDLTVQQVDVSAYTVPTDGHESDGTIEWDSTTIVVAEVSSGADRGIGYTYATAGAARIIRDHLAPAVVGKSAFDLPSCFDSMARVVRNIGKPGVASTAISAVDMALWDLKARILGIPLATLLGQVREGVTAYGSGGFTSYSISRLRQQLGTWAQNGLSAVKMKVGRSPADDADRVKAARDAIGPDTALFVDANGAYSRKQALLMAQRFAESDVRWFEEPVSSDDLDGLHLLRDRLPAGVEIAAGEYGYDIAYFRRMLSAGAVDVLQADATRCGGFSGFIKAAAVCESFGLPLSAHTAPSLHTHVCCALSPVRNVEYFYDHQRIEELFFDGAVKPAHGLLRPDVTRAGNGLVFKRQDALPYKIDT
jgi:L-alanine-DL-glutamate epimerase-like enolase superfamily enzyme